MNITKVQSNKLNKLPTKSAKIRYLTSLEYTRSEIAEKLQIRYQHVRNVQLMPLSTKK